MSLHRDARALPGAAATRMPVTRELARKTVGHRYRGNDRLDEHDHVL